MISIGLATRLRKAGLRWEPAVHDRFAIPDRDLDGRVFSLNDMSTEIRTFANQSAITFNGAVEWSLDWILRDEVVWLPTEEQLRDLLGDRFLGLEREGEGYVCRVEMRGDPARFSGASAADAYGEALLALL